MAHPYAPLSPGDRELENRNIENPSGDIMESPRFAGDTDGDSTFERSSGAFPPRSVSPLVESKHESGAPEYDLESFKNRKKQPYPSKSQSTVSIPSSIHDPAGPGSWYLEIGAVMLSFLALISTLVVLHYEDGKPIAQYSFYFSLNTVTSILGTTAKTSLAFALAACMGQGKWNWFRSRGSELVGFQRFDEASRGPWGSFKFLWWSQLRLVTQLPLIGRSQSTNSF
jgi:Protein of unknown function (DUF3176)